MVKFGSKIICFMEGVGGIANLFQQLMSSCQCRKIKAGFKVNRLSCALLTANCSALCRVFRVSWTLPCLYKWVAAEWMNVKCMWKKTNKHPTVNGHFLLLWLSWWPHDSSTVQCTCSCVVFMSMNYCWDCKFTVFAMHCSSFFILYRMLVCPPSPSLFSYSRVSSGN